MAEVNKHNLRYMAVKRILQGLMELQSNPSDDFMSLPLEIHQMAPPVPQLPSSPNY